MNSLPYRQGKRLPGEKASKVGHLEVLKSRLVLDLINDFESQTNATGTKEIKWEPINLDLNPLQLVFGIDGSYQEVQSELAPYKKLGFVKTAIIRLDQKALSEIDPLEPHPFVLRDLMKDSALYHATVFPLKHISIPGLNVYDTIRRVIYESVKDDSLGNEPMETLKWLAFEKWSGDKKSTPPFECPHCGKRNIASLEYDQETGECSSCHKELLITDMLGFHLDMSPDSAKDTVVNSYMSIHETLLLFTGIRLYWQHHREVLSKCLFVKDGPLSIRAQYSKLVNPIRRFFSFAKNQGKEIYVVGQEKTGTFWDYIEEAATAAPARSVFVPNDHFIKTEIQSRPQEGAPYGKDTNYGTKFFFKLNDYHHSVLSVPTGIFNPNPALLDLIGVKRILSTLKTMVSSKFEGGYLPVELANGIASLSTYPSAQILKIFSDSFN